MWRLTKEEAALFGEWADQQEELKGSQVVWGDQHTKIALMFAQSMVSLADEATEYAAVRGAELYAYVLDVLAKGMQMPPELRKRGNDLLNAISRGDDFVLPGEESGRSEDAVLCTCGHERAWHDGDRGCVHLTFQGGELTYCDCIEHLELPWIPRSGGGG